MNTQEQFKLDIENGNIEGVKKYIQDGGDVNYYTHALQPPFYPILGSLQNKEMFELLLNSLDMGEDYFYKWWEICKILASNNEEIIKLYLDKLTTIFPPHDNWEKYKAFLEGYINNFYTNPYMWEGLIRGGYDIDRDIHSNPNHHFCYRMYIEGKDYAEEVLHFQRAWKCKNIKPARG